MKLLLDVGNTRIKWALHDGGPLIERGFVRHRGVPAGTWVGGLPRRDGMTSIIVANVAGEVLEAALRDWARRTAPGLEVRFLRAAANAGGVRNAYAVPELLGVDRWLGMIGVRRTCGDAFLLVGAGTAFTVDLVNEGGRHCGGLIAPGRSMMIETLREKTGNIASAAAAAPASSDGMFGLNTAGAVDRGASYALAGLVGHAIREGMALCGSLRLFVHGGDSGDVFDIVADRHVHELKAGVETMNDAVLVGLAVLAREGGFS